MSDKAISRRLPAWCALAELFLDTELQPADYDRIVDALLAADLSVCSAERILLEEVAPAFMANILGIAGEWSGWREDFVKERVLGHLNSNAARRAVANFCASRHRKLFNDGWEQVAARLRRLETAP